jgi:hypothetical protein
LVGFCTSLTNRERIGGSFAMVTLLVFAGVGVDMVVRPSRHMNCYLIGGGGGEMLQGFNEAGVQFSGERQKVGGRPRNSV